jgi:TonB family protein
MDTVAQPPADPELHLLTSWSEPGRRERTRSAAIGSLVSHVALIALVVLLPSSMPPPRQLPEVRRTVTPLIEPLTELTQKPPNTAKVTKEFNAHEMVPRPRIQIPQGAMSTTRPAAPRPAPPVPPTPAPKAAEPKPEPEPPKIEARVAPPPPKIEAPGIQPPAPPPQIQAEEKPKSLFENVGPAAKGAPAGRSAVPMPSGSVVDDAVRQAIRNAPGGLTVGDSGVGVGGVGPGANLPPAAGARGADIQLLSDPMGVDFRAYLIQILASVRRNWRAVMPESVQLGRRGQVAIQFSIARDGKVPKLVIATTSGQDPLDRAAIAGISASSPFPALPAEFKGDRIVVQFNFSYNMPPR